MEISIFLARVIGLYLVIISLFIFIKHANTLEIMKSITKERGTLFLLAITTLVIGLLLVVSHNIWVKDWRLIITLMAWLILLAGIFRLFFLEYIMRTSEWWIKHKEWTVIISVLFFLLGIFLTYKGFS